jgi:endonuclease/exonuclease/phosphatase family metal-dependent hydrolase
MRRLLSLTMGLAGSLLLACCATTVPSLPPPEAAPPTAAASSRLFHPEPPPVPPANGLRVATLNTEFLFDGLGEEGGADFPHKGDPLKARLHRDRIGTILRRLDADLVLLVEVEHRDVLQQLVDESLADLGYSVYFVQGEDTFTGQDLGLLSRIPIDSVGRTDERAPIGATRQTQGVSKNLFARLTLAGQATTLIGVHFLSRPSDPSRKDQRQGQAEVIRRLVAREQALGRAVAVLGDFNDFDETTSDRNGNQPITDVLARIKSAGPGPEDDLRNVLAEVPPEERFTAHWDRNTDEQVAWDELSAIDHILLSPALYRRLRAVQYIQAHDPLTYSDHFPVMITLE